MKKPQMIAMVDTSGSINPKMYMCIEREIRNMARTFDVVVIEHDCQVVSAYHFKGRLGHVRPRGGTDLKPPFKRVSRYYPNAVMVLVFTDGYVYDAPPCDPEMPVFWYMMTRDTRAPRSWGQEVPVHMWL